MKYKIVAICITTLFLLLSFCVGSIEAGVEPVGTLCGYVWDERDDPIVGAYVNVSFHVVEFRDGFTDINGYYFISDIPVCICSKNVSVVSDGYKDQYKEIGIHPFDLTWCNFTLVKKCIPVPCSPLVKNCQ